jgi:hypothetical protein
MLNHIQVSIIVEYTRRDFSEGLRMLNRSQNYHLLFRIFAIVAFLFASFYLYITLNPTTSSQIPAYLILLFFILAFFLWFDIPRVLTARRTFNKFQEQDFENIKLTVNVDGVFSKTNLSQSHSGWEQFINTFENDELFLLVLESKNFLIFPKRYFQVNADINSFRELAKAKVPEYKMVK